MQNLKKGAETLMSQPDIDPAQLIEELYLTTLTRFPTEEESSVLKDALGTKPTVEDVTDILWALTMTPEFLITR
jgi:hypothetical protein